MSNDYIEESRSTKLAFWGLGQMMKGAALGAAFIISIGVFMWAIYLLGLLLPEESRQTPSPYGALHYQTVPMGHDLA